jgi:hypothetical protein
MAGFSHPQHHDTASASQHIFSSLYKSLINAVNQVADGARFNFKHRPTESE